MYTLHVQVLSCLGGLVDGALVYSNSDVGSNPNWGSSLLLWKEEKVSHLSWWWCIALLRWMCLNYLIMYLNVYMYSMHADKCTVPHRSLWLLSDVNRFSSTCWVGRDWSMSRTTVFQSQLLLWYVQYTWWYRRHTCTCISFKILFRFMSGGRDITIVYTLTQLALHVNAVCYGL